jgi:hypothetical protein
MHLKDIYKTFAVIWGLIFFGALGVAIYRHELTFKGWLEAVWWFSFAIASIGAMTRLGANKGVRMAPAEGVVRATDSRETFVHEFNKNAATGFAFGTVVIMAAAPIFGISLAILYLRYP